MKSASAIKLILPIALVLGSIGAVSIGSLVAQPTNQNNGEIDVSTPEPTPNPVKDSETGSDGIDPELVQIQEPDNVDLDPNSKSADTGERDANPKVDAKDVDDLKKAVAEQAEKSKDETKTAANTIPFIPINLLFPQGSASVTKTIQFEEVAGTSVIILGLNRDTGQNMQFRVNVGSTVNYENLSISVGACYKSKPEFPNESWAYVDVVDKGATNTQQLAVLAQRNRAKLKEAQGAHRLRKGWIIASSPTVTAIDHPVYDITLIRCEGGAANVVSTPSVGAKTQGNVAPKKS